MEFLAFMFVWGLPMWICGSIAARRGHNVALWLLICFLFSWLAVIFAALMQDRKAQRREIERLRQAIESKDVH